MKRKFNVIIEKGGNGYLMSEVIELPGCHTQAKTLNELIKRTRDAIRPYISSASKVPENSNFIGWQQVWID